MIQKEIELKTPVILGTKEDGSILEINKVILREPTAGDLRGLSLKSLLSDNKTEDWVVLLNRISTPKLPPASFDIMPASEFVAMVYTVTQMLNGQSEEDTKEEIKKDSFKDTNKEKKSA